MTDATERERLAPFLLGILCTLVLVVGGCATVVAGVEAIADNAFCLPIDSEPGGLTKCQHPQQVGVTMLIPPLFIAPAAIVLLWARLRRPDRPRLWAAGVGIGLLIVVWLVADWIAPGRLI